jgi:acetyltransferase
MNYLYEHERMVFRTRRGRPIGARRVVSEDTPLLADMLARLSDDSRWLRYMSPRPLRGDAGLAEARRIAGGHPALVALARVGDTEEALGVAELVPATSAQGAEIALVVRDDEQSGGIGGVLLSRLIEIARWSGITYLTGDVLAENRVMLRLLARLGLPHTTVLSRGVVHVRLEVPAETIQVPSLSRQRVAVQRR